MEASAPTSPERATLQALLCASVPGPALRGLSNVRELRRKERAVGIANFERGVAGLAIKTKKWRVQRTRTPTIKNLVRWALRSDNVQLLSWGVKKVRIGKEWKTIPCISRTISTRALLELRYSYKVASVHVMIKCTNGILV